VELVVSEAVMARFQRTNRSWLFKFEEHEIQVVLDEKGEPWFRANEVCIALGYANPRDVLTTHVDEDDVAQRDTIDSKGSTQLADYVSESGLYGLIFGSQMPVAKRLKRWVKRDVLPSIRKTDAYVVPMAAVRNAVAKLFLRPKLGAWAKRFPDEFYWHIYRLRGWTWRDMEVNHPQVVALYTIDFIYERLAPGLLMELEKHNPADTKGNRKARHHQFLTEDIGHPALAQHLYAVLCIMRVSQTWDQLTLALDRYHPRQGRNLLLSLVDELLPPP
jgi:prophage antirepressor-like protein